MKQQVGYCQKKFSEYWKNLYSHCSWKFFFSCIKKTLIMVVALFCIIVLFQIVVTQPNPLPAKKLREKINTQHNIVTYVPPQTLSLD